MPRMSKLCSSVLLMLACASARADLPVEPLGVEPLSPPDQHRAYLVDMEFDSLVMGRITIVDPENSKYLGMLSTGFGAAAALGPVKKNLYTAETFFSRGARGERLDMLTAYDTTTLKPLWEVEIPKKRASSIVEKYALSISEDEHFAWVFNLTPATSISVVDLKNKKFAGEIDIAGCILAYPAGPKRFASICGDGQLLIITLDDKGKEVKRSRMPFFDPKHDLVLERGAMDANGVFHYVSYKGMVHAVDLKAEQPKVLEPWSLVSEDEAKQNWRPGGWQMTAISPALNRLYVLVHPDGKVGSHKDPSTTVWAFDLKTHQKVQTLTSEEPIWSLQATSDAKPLLLGATVTGSLVSFDLESGKLVNTVKGIQKTAPLVLSH